jgi:RNA polymerase sigma-70 factor (ECF subfamily)
MDYPNLTAEELIEECTHSAKPEAWKEFVRRFQPLIAGVVLRTAKRYGQLSVPLVDDLVQETYLRLCTDEWKLLRKFRSRGDGSIYGFMKTVARTVALDYFKAQYSGKRGAGVLSRGDFQIALQRAAKKQVLENQVLVREIDKRLAQIAATPRDKQIFILYYRHGLTTKAIAELLGTNLSQKGVESCLLRLTRQLQRELAGPAKA